VHQRSLLRRCADAIALIFGFRRQRSMDDRLRDEIGFHIDMAAQRNERAGLPPDEARRAAVVSFGGREQWREAARDEVRSAYLDELRADIRYALRGFRRAPAFTVAAVATLALSVGATTSIFSVVNAVLLRALPYPNAERIVAVCEKNVAKPASAVCTSGGVNPANFLAWRDASRSFTEMAAFFERRVSVSRPGADPISAPARVTSASVFRVLGATPALGRWFTDAEDRAGGPSVVVVSHALWQQEFGGDPGVIGKHLLVNGTDFTVVGVAAADLEVFEPVDVWVPLRLGAAQRSARGRFLRALALLAPRVPVDVADREMQSIARRRLQEAPEINANWTAFVMPLRDKLVGDSERALWTLLAAVGFLLLIACANVANLLVARAADREPEVAVRVSMGASPGRIVRQLLTESLVLSVVAAGLGLLIAVKGTQALVALVPAGLSLQALSHVSVDWRVLTFVTLVAVGTGVLFGSAPAYQSKRANVNETLRKAGRSGAGSLSSARLRNALVVAEMSLALVLLAGAGLMVRSLSALQHVNLGFRPEGVLTAQVSLPRRYQTDTATTQFFQEFESRISGLAGVQAVGSISYLPLTGLRSTNGFNVEGRPAAAPGAEPVGDIRAVTPRYFTAMGIPIVEGRAVTDADGIGSTPVAVVSQTLARTMWPNESAIGHYLLYQWEHAERVRIVGVAGDVHHDGPDKQTYMEIYRPLSQLSYNAMTLVVRTNGDPASFAAPIRGVLRDVDREVTLATMQPMAALVAQALGTTRLSTALFGLFGVLGLVLAAIGIYGVMSYTVQQRRHEIGVRLALGAPPRTVLAIIVRRGLLLSLTGIGIGTVAALLATRIMQKLLYGVPPNDVGTFAAVTAILAAVGLLAAYLPARRATRVDAVMVLRGE
jgi:putative ABC transport system permease protein